MYTKEEAHQKIAGLVARFDDQKEFYTKADYNETLTRRDFIDPFWKALGWDIDNENGYAESYREVIHEDKVKIGGATKAPDYSFRLVGGKRLFFLEAKKPSVYIKDEILPAYQVRRYGWSAKMAISVISDFEEFAIYDCTTKPKPTDKASNGRIKYLTYDRYLSEFDFIWNTFSKERVLKGSFDKYILNDKAKKGTSTVDHEFLGSLDNWRRELALNIALRNKGLDEEQLNFVVQHIIDRIIFLRIAEDRSVETYGDLQNATKSGDFYQNVIERFHIAHQKYNSGLFDFQKDQISTHISIDNKVIKNIINDLYYPTSPYEFSVLPLEILGSAYEQFLGKKIFLSKSGRAIIEEKPEVRKAGGVYYTPQFIVDYIVKNAIAKVVDGKNPTEISKIKIIDPACGSGSFLIGAYQYLLNWHKDYYSKYGKKSKGEKNNPLTPLGELTTEEKKRILLNNIYGVDLDSSAVEVTKLSLLLKCMEGETKETIETQTKLFHNRILPTLDDNIKNGNSLIDLDYYDNQFDFGEDRKVKPFSWKKAFPGVFKQGGFDCVIGNPPYVKEYTSRETFEQIKKSHLLKYYQGKMDLWYFFMCYGLDILKHNGFLGFIVPNNWVTNAGASILRNKILTDSTIQTIIDFGAFMVFENASIQTMILVVEKKKSKNYELDYRRIELSKPTIYDAQNILRYVHAEGYKLITQEIKTDNLLNKFLTFGDSKTEDLLTKIQAKQNFILGKNEVACGIDVHQDFLNAKGEKTLNYTIPKGSGIFNVTLDEKSKINPNSKEDYLFKPFYTTEELAKYYGDPRNKLWVIYTSSEFKDPSIMKDYPNIKRHLDQFKKMITSDNKPYGLHRSRDENFFLGNKIISLRKCSKPTFTYTNFDCYVSQTFFIIKTNRLNLKYLTAFLNSKLVAFWLKNKGKMQGNLYQIDKEPILNIPIFNPSNIIILEQVVKYVDEILKYNKELQTVSLPNNTEHLKNRIDYCEAKINKLIYEIYGLTNEEISLIDVV